MKHEILVTSDFDGGNGRMRGKPKVESGVAHVDVAITPDPYTDTDKCAHYQWFNFRLANLHSVSRVVINVVNAGGASYTDGWINYNACYSFNRNDWLRAQETTYGDGVLSIPISLPEGMTQVQVAYFAPYSQERHFDLIATSAAHPRCRHETLGHTLDGAPMDLLVINGESASSTAVAAAEKKKTKKNVWVIARQHPGETMAEFFMEGFLERILDTNDPIARELLKHATVYAVPNMCPDGARRGHLRTNAAGTNLNREWAKTDMQRCPEVSLVLAAMDAYGVDGLIDVHGDEALPYNFISGMEGCPCWNEHFEKLQADFLQSYCAASPDFQTKFGYDIDKPGMANLNIGSNGVAERFKCLSLTLEMPFKDTADDPEPVRGWSPQRCATLGAALLNPLVDVVHRLR